MKNSKKFNKVIGNDGENRAAQFLESQGYSIVERNYRIRLGEIDIIASKDNILVFVEVKTLPGGNAEILAHELGSVKQKRIIETAKYFLLNNRKYNDSLIRFDAVVVDLPGYPDIYHIQNVFSEFL